MNYYPTISAQKTTEINKGTIYIKSHEPSFWEVKDTFVLLAYPSLAASRTLWQRLLACLTFTLDAENLFC